MQYTFQGHTNFAEKINRTIAAHPEDPALEDRIADARHDYSHPEKLFEILPAHRLEGAFLAYESHAHWLIALVTAILSLFWIMVAIPRSITQRKPILVSILFTATVGVFLLLVFQRFALFTVDSPTVISFGPAGLLHIVVKFIGFSYYVTNNPDSNFLLAFFGFTFGVGLCEEVTKAIPLLWSVRKNAADLSWRALFVRGFASGAGFGVAEGIMYAGYYNGICHRDIYIVRFISCVCLHAIWSGTVAIQLHNRTEWLRATNSGWIYSACVLPIIFLPMTLHGLYDTLLTKDHDVLALIVALASFAILAYKIEIIHRQEPQAALAQ